MSRALGVDPGERRVGLAISDEDGVIAQPLSTLTRRGDAQVASEIAKLVREREVATVVVGLALRLDGSEGERARRARALVAALRRAVHDGVDVVTQDERLTSVAAERALGEAGVREKQRRREGLTDRVAAALLLQAFLDERRASLASARVRAQGGLQGPAEGDR
ncbi:MAG: Holliday junction resolvase RuvX [Deltaproteobacteria bacterium]|nr:Holliday junction resolvase RuvX [Deltaproteobacteria bacterium]